MFVNPCAGGDKQTDVPSLSHSTNVGVLGFASGLEVVGWGSRFSNSGLGALGLRFQGLGFKV